MSTPAPTHGHNRTASMPDLRPAPPTTDQKFATLFSSLRTLLSEEKDGTQNFKTRSTALGSFEAHTRTRKKQSSKPITIEEIIQAAGVRDQDNELNRKTIQLIQETMQPFAEELVQLFQDENSYLRVESDRKKGKEAGRTMADRILAYVNNHELSPEFVSTLSDLMRGAHSQTQRKIISSLTSPRTEDEKDFGAILKDPYKFFATLSPIAKLENAKSLYENIENYKQEHFSHRRRESSVFKAIGKILDKGSEIEVDKINLIIEKILFGSERCDIGDTGIGNDILQTLRLCKYAAEQEKKNNEIPEGVLEKYPHAPAMEKADILKKYPHALTIMFESILIRAATYETELYAKNLICSYCDASQYGSEVTNLLKSEAFKMRDFCPSLAQLFRERGIQIGEQNATPRTSATNTSRDNTTNLTATTQSSQQL